MFEGSRARFILTCEENKSPRLKGIQLNTPKLTISKKSSKYLKSRDRLTSIPLAEKLSVILKFFLVPHVKRIWRTVKLFEKLCDY